MIELVRAEATEQGRVLVSADDAALFDCSPEGARLLSERLLDAAKAADAAASVAFRLSMDAEHTSGALSGLPAMLKSGHLYAGEALRCYPPKSQEAVAEVTLMDDGTLVDAEGKVYANPTDATSQILSGGVKKSHNGWYPWKACRKKGPIRLQTIRLHFGRKQPPQPLAEWAEPFSPAVTAGDAPD